MDWKAWYRAEAESDAGQAAVVAAVARFPDGDAEVRAALASGGAASFPHVTLRDSAEPLARVATSVVAGRFERVVALGVLHSSSLPERERGLVPAAARGEEDALRSVGGAFVAEGDARTPFGVVPAGPAPREGPWVRRGGRLVEGEFSLDLFLAVLGAAAKARGRTAPAVTRAFVGTTVTERGAPSTEIAAAVADAVRPLLGPKTALIATGDLVHAGNGYAPAAEVAALPREPERLRAHFAERSLAMLAAAFAGGRGAGGTEAADRIARELRCDQRHALPVLAALVGRGREPVIRSFALSDYGPILGQPAPCVVACALWTVATAKAS